MGDAKRPENARGKGRIIEREREREREREISSKCARCENLSFK